MNDIRTKISINLESLLDLSAKLNETNDEMFILNSALLSLMGKLRIFRACVLLPVNQQEKYKVILSKGRLSLDEIPFFRSDSFHKLDCINPSEKILCDSGYKYFLPIYYRNDPIAAICLGNRLDNTEPDEEEEHYAKLVSTIAANAMQNVRSRQSLVKAKNNLENRNQLLAALFETSRDFSMLLSREQILKMLSYRLMGQMMVSRFAVILIHDNKCHPIINRFDITLADSVVCDFLKYDKTINFNNVPVPQSLNKFVSDSKAEILSPMKIQGSTRGYLLVGRKMNGEGFSEENLQFIEALGNTAIAALENERLFQEELAKKQLERELKIALEIQKNLLPKQVPPIAGFELAGYSLPSQLVGGDYYDFIELPGDEILIAIADVSGKGIPAALLMANVQAALRVLAPLSLPLKELVLKINNIVFQNTSPDRFVTFFCGILNKKERTFRYLNAGHNPPFLLKEDGLMLSLTEGGLILGFLDEPLPYGEGEIILEPRDIIVFYTDGVTEAMNINNTEFGEENLRKLIINNQDRDSEALLREILLTIHNYSEGVPQSDDITLVVLKTL